MLQQESPSLQHSQSLSHKGKAPMEPKVNRPAMPQTTPQPGVVIQKPRESPHINFQMTNPNAFVASGPGRSPSKGHVKQFDGNEGEAITMDTESNPPT